MQDQFRHETVRLARTRRIKVQLGPCIADNRINDGQSKTRPVPAVMGSFEPGFKIIKIARRDRRSAIGDPDDVAICDRNLDRLVLRPVSERIFNQIAQTDGKGIMIDIGLKRCHRVAVIDDITTINSRTHQIINHQQKRRPQLLIMPGRAKAAARFGPRQLQSFSASRDNRLSDASV